MRVSKLRYDPGTYLVSTARSESLSTRRRLPASAASLRTRKRISGGPRFRLLTIERFVDRSATTLPDSTDRPVFTSSRRNAEEAWTKLRRFVAVDKGESGVWLAK